jgi:hypothetical protein
MKKFILGFLCAAMLFTAIPIGAAIQEYALKLSAAKIVVDGSEFKDEKLPVLYLDPGYNYIPAAVFRSICDKIGVGFEYDSETKEMQIDTKAATVKSDTLTTTETDTGGDIVSDTVEKITQTPDGLPVFQYNEENYIGWLELRKKCESLGLHFKIENNAFNFKNPDDTLICSIDLFTTYDPFNSVKYDDYVNKALPLIK